MDGHALAGTIDLGSALVTIDEWPTWLAMEREKRRITRWAGSSSDHSLFTSMSNRLLPFGDAQRVEAGFLDAEKGKVKRASVPPLGPRGKSLLPDSGNLA